jgi:hypothetical protein
VPYTRRLLATSLRKINSLYQRLWPSLLVLTPTPAGARARLHQNRKDFGAVDGNAPHDIVDEETADAFVRKGSSAIFAISF